MDAVVNTNSPTQHVFVCLCVCVHMQVARHPDCEAVVTGIVGCAGLLPTGRCSSIWTRHVTLPGIGVKPVWWSELYLFARLQTGFNLSINYHPAAYQL